MAELFIESLFILVKILRMEFILQGKEVIRTAEILQFCYYLGEIFE